MRLTDIAHSLGCELRGDGSIEIRQLAPIDEAGPGDLTFVANPRYRSHLARTRASAVILASAEPDVPLPSLRTAEPYLAFARAIALFYVPPPSQPGVHPTAVIAAGAQLAASAAVGPYCVIGEGVVIGERARLDAHVTIYPETTIGDDFRAYAGVTVRERVRIGARVTLQSGCVIGGDGFGYVAGATGIEKIIQAGTVVIEDDVEIGSNTTVDRATIGSTVIRRGAKLDNLVMIAHGCEVGEASLLAAQVGLSGSTRVGRGVRMGGQVGTAGHQLIGDGAQIAAQSGVPNDVAAGAVVGGYPAEPIQVWRRVSAALPRLPELLRRVRRLERQLGVVP